MDIKRDYITTRPLLEEKAEEFSDGVWNKFEGDIGECLIKFLASCSHTVDYYYRKFIRNLFLPTTSWKSKTYIWELIGYKAPYIRATFMTVQLYWPNCGLLSYVPIYMYTPFKVTADGQEYKFLAAEDYLIPPYTSRVNIRLVQGELKHVHTDKKDIPFDCSIQLTETDIDYDLVTVMVGSVKWKQVRNTFFEPSPERTFSIHKSETGIYVQLPKNWEQWVSDLDQFIDVYYVEAAEDEFDEYTEDCMTVEFEEAVMDTYGVDVSDFYQIRPLVGMDLGEEVLPSTTTWDRAITTDDFTERALQYPLVGQAKAYSWDNALVVNEPFFVRVIASGKKVRTWENPNTGKLEVAYGLTDRVKESMIQYFKLISSPLLRFEVVDPQPNPIYVQCFVDLGPYTNTIVETQIRLQLFEKCKEYFKVGNREIGVEIDDKDLSFYLMKTDERIVYLEAVTTALYPVTPFSIPIYGDAVFHMDSAAKALYDIFYVTETCDTIYNVFLYEDVLGKDYIQWLAEVQNYIQSLVQDQERNPSDTSDQNAYINSKIVYDALKSELYEVMTGRKITDLATNEEFSDNVPENKLTAKFDSKIEKSIPRKFFEAPISVYDPDYPLLVTDPDYGNLVWKHAEEVLDVNVTSPRIPISVPAGVTNITVYITYVGPAADNWTLYEEQADSTLNPIFSSLMLLPMPSNDDANKPYIRVQVPITTYRDKVEVTIEGNTSNLYLDSDGLTWSANIKVLYDNPLYIRSPSNSEFEDYMLID